MQKVANPVDVILEFIVSTYPICEYPKVLEIAAGNGNLSKKLSDFGYQVTAMDPKLVITKNTTYRQILEPFTQNTDISDYDLGIAIHPCGIHQDIIQNFKVNEKALFLIPCCVFSCEDRELTGYYKNQDWLDYLSTIHPKMKSKKFFYAPYHSFSHAFYLEKE